MSYYTPVTTQTKDLSPQGAGIAEDAEITAFSAPHEDTRSEDYAEIPLGDFPVPDEQRLARLTEFHDDEDEPFNRPYGRRESPGQPEGGPQHPDMDRAAASMQAVSQGFHEDITAHDALEILRTALRTDREGEGVLFTQVQLLDGLFHRVMINALTAIDHEDKAKSDLANDRRLTMALRAQNQCRNTLNAMNTIRENNERKFNRGRYF